MNKCFEFRLHSKEFFSGVYVFLSNLNNTCEFESRVKYEFVVGLRSINIDERFDYILLTGGFGFGKTSYSYNLDKRNPLMDLYYNVNDELVEYFDFGDGYILSKEDGLVFNDCIYFKFREVEEY